MKATCGFRKVTRMTLLFNEVPDLALCLSLLIHLLLSLAKDQPLTAWWLNQPNLHKIFVKIWESSPSRGEDKIIWNHHLVKISHFRVGMGICRIWSSQRTTLISRFWISESFVFWLVSVFFDFLVSIFVMRTDFRCQLRHQIFRSQAFPFTFHAFPQIWKVWTPPHAALPRAPPSPVKLCIRDPFLLLMAEILKTLPETNTKGTLKMEVPAIPKGNDIWCIPNIHFQVQTCCRISEASTDSRPSLRSTWICFRSTLIFNPKKLGGNHPKSCHKRIIWKLKGWTYQDNFCYKKHGHSRRTHGTEMKRNTQDKHHQYVTATWEVQMQTVWASQQ